MWSIIFPFLFFLTCSNSDIRFHTFYIYLSVALQKCNLANLQLSSLSWLKFLTLLQRRALFCSSFLWNLIIHLAMFMLCAAGFQDGPDHGHESARLVSAEHRGLLRPSWPMEAGVGEGRPGPRQPPLHPTACCEVGNKSNTFNLTHSSLQWIRGSVADGDFDTSSPFPLVPTWVGSTGLGFYGFRLGGRTWNCVLKKKKKNVLNTYSTGLLSSAKTWCQLASQWCNSMSHESTPLRKSKLPFLKPSNKWNGYTKNPQWSQSDKKLYTEQQVCHRLDVLHCFGVCVMYNEVMRPRCYNNPALGDTRL